jgi:predicted CxxxxCH...CXXCH cytochrome family protein
MPTPRLALLALAVCAITLAACDEARTIDAPEGSSSAESCSICHGFPPPAPHPQSQSCFTCHPATVDAENRIIPGGPHANGVKDVSVVGHPDGYVASHSGDAIADIQSCSACHGTDYDGGLAQAVSPGVEASCNDCHAAQLQVQNWQSNCTFCHGTRDPAFTFDNLPKAAPPQGVRQGSATTDPQVGAHQKHLGNGSEWSNGFQCQTCHTLNGSLAHLDGNAPVEFGALPLASAEGVTPTFTKSGQTCAVYCHGSSLEGGAATQPVWTSSLACNSCHGLPPSSGPEALPTAHRFHAVDLGVGCSACHAGYDTASVNKATHVNGTREVVFAGVTINGWDCNTCHALR